MNKKPVKLTFRPTANSGKLVPRVRVLRVGEPIGFNWRPFVAELVQGGLPLVFEFFRTYKITLTRR